MKRSTNYPIHWFTVFLFTISISWGQIKTSTTLDEAIHKALEKSLSQKNKKLEIEKLNLQEKEYGISTFQLLKPAPFIPISIINLLSTYLPHKFQ